MTRSQLDRLLEQAVAGALGVAPRVKSDARRQAHPAPHLRRANAGKTGARTTNNTRQLLPA